MSPPIRDGSGSSIGSIRLGDGSEISEVRTGAGDVVFSASAIPDSVVSWSPDSQSSTNDNLFGVIIESDDDWVSIGAKLSTNVSGIVVAKIYEVSTNDLIAQKDVSSLSGGDTFTMDDVNLNKDTEYSFVVGDDSGSWDYDFLSDTSASPIESSDNNLRITGMGDGSSKRTDVGPHALVEVGNVGFD